MKKHRLINGVERNKENPDTFLMLPEIERESVRVDDVVKLGFEAIEPSEFEFSERMWVIVTGAITSVTHKGKIKSIWFKGKIDNNPLSLGLEYEEEVDFTPENILAIWRD